MIINNDSNKDNINKIDNINILNNSKNIITVDDNNLQKNINGIDFNNSLKQNINYTDFNNNLKQNINYTDFNNNLKSTINYKDLENRILSMNLNGFKNFFYIIKKNNENYTLKKEHILINLGKLKNETLNEILQFVNFYEQKENEMIKLESEINKYKKS